MPARDDALLPLPPALRCLAPASRDARHNPATRCPCPLSSSICASPSSSICASHRGRPSTPAARCPPNERHGKGAELELELAMSLHVVDTIHCSLSPQLPRRRHLGLQRAIAVVTLPEVSPLCRGRGKRGKLLSQTTRGTRSGPSLPSLDGCSSVTRMSCSAAWTTPSPATARGSRSRWPRRARRHPCRLLGSPPRRPPSAAPILECG
jgi:hypothetical protein